MTYQPFHCHPSTPAFKLPPGSVDTHMHVFGPENRYPYTKERSYTPTDAPLEAYQQMANTVGITRTVVVQPSVYGIDNRATRDAVKTLGSRKGRGVAVISPTITDAELAGLHADGFRGIRLNLLFKGGVDFSAIQALAGRLADFGWHIQFLVDVSQFNDLYERLSALPTDIVIDHMGHMPASAGIRQPGFRALLKLVDAGRSWVKLSGPYRFTAEQTPPYGDVTPFARALIHANPERMLWGSDWPHPHIPVPMPDDGALVDMLDAWVPDEATLNRIMVTNPETLYCFERFE